MVLYTALITIASGVIVVIMSHTTLIQWYHFEQAINVLQCTQCTTPGYELPGSKEQQPTTQCDTPIAKYQMSQNIGKVACSHCQRTCSTIHFIGRRELLCIE